MACFSDRRRRAGRRERSVLATAHRLAVVRGHTGVGGGGAGGTACRGMVRLQEWQQTARGARQAHGTAPVPRGAHETSDRRAAWLQQGHTPKWTGSSLSPPTRACHTRQGALLARDPTESATLPRCWNRRSRVCGGTMTCVEVMPSQACAELNYSDHMSMAYAIGLGHGLAHSMFFFLG